MNKPYFIAFLLSLALWTVIPSVFAGDVVLKVFEGKPRINSPHIIGNYPSTPFIFIFRLPVSDRCSGVRKTPRRTGTGFQDWHY